MEVDSVNDVEEIEEVVEALPMIKHLSNALAQERLVRETMGLLRYMQGTCCSRCFSPHSFTY